MIPLLDKTELTLLRYGATTYSEGLPVRPEPSEVEIVAAVTPASADTIERMPEGVSVRHAVELYTYSEIRAADEDEGTDADRFDHNGRTYEVQSATRYPAHSGQPEHYEAAAIAVAALPMPEGSP